MMFFILSVWCWGDTIMGKEKKVNKKEKEKEEEKVEMDRLLETLPSGLQKFSWKDWRKKRDPTVLFNFLLLNFGRPLNKTTSWNRLIWGEVRGETLIHLLFITGINEGGGGSNFTWSTVCQNTVKFFELLSRVKWGSKGIWTSRVSRWSIRQVVLRWPMSNAILLALKYEYSHLEQTSLKPTN